MVEVLGDSIMASLSELVAAAQVTQNAKDNSNPWANRAAAAIEGIALGREQRRQESKDTLDRSLKLLEIQEKMARIKHEETQARIQGNLAKAAGLLPMDENENMIARSTANAEIGGGQKTPVNSMGGKLKKFLETNEVSGVYFGKSGMSFSFQKPGKGAGAKGGKGQTPGQEAALKKKIWDQAAKMALADMQEEARRSGDAFMTGVPSNPTEDRVKKYLPAAAKFYGQDPEDYATPLPQQMVTDPLGLLGNPLEVQP